MKKSYISPEAEVISFYTEVSITTDAGISGESTVVACADDSWL